MGAGARVAHAHILLRVAAAVLIRPLKLQDGALVETHRAVASAGRGLVVIVLSIGASRLAIVAYLVPSVSVVLGIEEAVGIQDIVPRLMELIV